jgi:GH24 family phage-related lysozyme (muramidase)
MIPQAAINLILSDEGVDQPWEWPGGDSGITIGHGYDLGFESEDRFVKDWTPQIGTATVNELKVAIDKTGAAAERLAQRFRGIHITKAQADAVFFASTLPEYEAETEKAFPGVDSLPDAVRGALVSLVFNRGTSLDGPRRREMLEIHNAIQRYTGRTAGLATTLEAIAGQIRSMKRLWVGQGLDGLLTRRDEEARLVESAMPA